ncbi:MAG: hypothetical protein O7E49_11520, partial [Gemmatimonadetes bacterium]|nr:hypothetical protein [Gemmatimonadota bacterium]
MVAISQTHSHSQRKKKVAKKKENTTATAAVSLRSEEKSYTLTGVGRHAFRPPSATHFVRRSHESPMLYAGARGGERRMRYGRTSRLRRVATWIVVGLGVATLCVWIYVAVIFSESPWYPLSSIVT